MKKPAFPVQETLDKAPSTTGPPQLPQSLFVKEGFQGIADAYPSQGHAPSWQCQPPWSPILGGRRKDNWGTPPNPRQEMLSCTSVAIPETRRQGLRPSARPVIESVGANLVFALENAPKPAIVTVGGTALPCPHSPPRRDEDKVKRATSLIQWRG